MLIDLASLGDSATAVEVEFDPSEIDLDGESAKLVSKTILKGHIERLDAKVRLSGCLKADLDIDCTRCLETVSRHADFSFRATFVESTGEAVTDEVGEDELDESLVEGGQIDMAEVVREQMLLDLPEQILCRNDCKGLCSKCGSNLNLIDCKCAEPGTDPRWAALKSLK